MMSLSANRASFIGLLSHALFLSVDKFLKMKLSILASLVASTAAFQAAAPQKSGVSRLSDDIV